MRFTIRDLLWLTLVVAIPLGFWIAFQTRNNVRMREAEAKTEALVESTNHTPAAPNVPSPETFNGPD